LITQFWYYTPRLCNAYGFKHTIVVLLTSNM